MLQFSLNNQLTFKIESHNLWYLWFYERTVIGEFGIDHSQLFQKCHHYRLFRLAYLCCFGIEENLDFPDFLKTKSLTKLTTSPVVDVIKLFGRNLDFLKNRKLNKCYF